MNKSVYVDQRNFRCPACHGVIKFGAYVWVDAVSGLRFHECCGDC
jgi:hypothetical protein